MKLEFYISKASGRAVSPLTAVRLQAGGGAQGTARPTVVFRVSRAFTLIEILVVMALMTLIVVSLMTVFSATQSAFRASLTQTDVLESGRVVMGLIKNDMDSMTRSLDLTNGAVNFYARTNVFQYQSGSKPLVQSLVGVNIPNTWRTNVLENFFILTRQGTTWTGTGYVVDTTATNSFNPLYRYSSSADVNARNGPVVLYNNFVNATFTNMTHLMDGVVHLSVRAYDPTGYWMTNNVDIYGGQRITNRNARCLPLTLGMIGYLMYSNTLPASVQIELGVLEDRPLQRAGSLFDLAPNLVRSNYLAQQAGKVHLFRQNFVIRNVDPSAYQ